MATNYDEFISKVRKTAEDVGETVGKAAHSAAKKTGEVAELAKLNLKVYNLNSENNDDLLEIGKMIYASRNGEMLDEERLEQLYQAIDGRKAEAEALKGRIGELKNTKTCPACGAAVAKDYSFCPVCGEKF